MFMISNLIAYQGQMVNVTPPPEKKDDRTAAPTVIPTGKSCWVDVEGGPFLEDSTLLEGNTLFEGRAYSEGQIVEKEMHVLRNLLKRLVDYEPMIFVISPFRSIAKICQSEFYKKDRIECGTVHSFQGKEADIVFLVLGTQFVNRQAREWVAASPNILNVAVTRAKQRLYVIGNANLWKVQRYFDQLAKELTMVSSERLF